MAREFTHIPQRSFDAFVGDLASLDAVLAALAVDPLEAEDAYKLFGVKGIPHSLKDFADRGRGAYRVALETIAQWVMPQKNAAFAMSAIFDYDPRLATWCGAQLARDRLEAVFVSSDAPRIAVDTAERWVRGEATEEQCMAAARASFTFRTAAMEMGTPLSDAAGAIALTAAYAAFYAVDSKRPGLKKGNAATAAANVVPYLSGATPGSAYWDEQKSAALRRLRSVVAEACLSYPAMM